MQVQIEVKNRKNKKAKTFALLNELEKTVGKKNIDLLTPASQKGHMGLGKAIGSLVANIDGGTVKKFAQKILEIVQTSETSLVLVRGDQRIELKAKMPLEQATLLIEAFMGIDMQEFNNASPKKQLSQKVKKLTTGKKTK